MAPGLTKKLIVQAALELLDEVGLGGLTVRALASRLGVQPPALYWHVRDKGALLDEMGTTVWRQIQFELSQLPADIVWDDEMRAFADTTRRTLLAHRDGARTFSGTYMMDAAVLQRQEAGLRRWLDQGFTLADAVRAYSMLNSFTIGFCIEEQAITTAPDDGRYEPAARSQRIGAAEHPLSAVAGEIIFADADTRFADQIGLIIDAVGRLRH